MSVILKTKMHSLTCVVVKKEITFKENSFYFTFYISAHIEMKKLKINLYQVGLHPATLRYFYI